VKKSEIKSQEVRSVGSVRECNYRESTDAPRHILPPYDMLIFIQSPQDQSGASKCSQE
jgi:hypothetical protein